MPNPTDPLKASVAHDDVQVVSISPEPRAMSNVNIWRWETV